MPKYVIEREFPGAGDLSPQELQGIAQKSCSVLQNLGPQIQWVESYVTDDKVYCIYIAPSEDMGRALDGTGGSAGEAVSSGDDSISSRLSSFANWKTGRGATNVFGG